MLSELGFVGFLCGILGIAGWLLGSLAAGEGIDRWWWPVAEDYRRQIVWRGSKNEHAVIRRPLNPSIEARPPAFDVLGPPEAYVPFYDPGPRPDRVNSDWVCVFTGSYGDFDACNEARFGVALMGPDLDFYTFVYRDEKLEYGFRFLGVPAFGD